MLHIIQTTLLANLLPQTHTVQTILLPNLLPQTHTVQTILLPNLLPQTHHHHLFSFRRSVQDYKIQMDMEIVTFSEKQGVKPLQSVHQ
jgi:hypothetical protein